MPSRKRIRTTAVEHSALLRRLPTPQQRRTIRERSGLSQAFVARDLDVSSALVGKWERGEATPSRRTLRPYLDLLDSLNALRGESTEGDQS